MNETISPAGGLAAAVHDHPVDESVTEAVSNVGRMPEIPIVDIDGGLHLGGGDPAVRSLGHDVNVAVLGQEAQHHRQFDALGQSAKFGHVALADRTYVVGEELGPGRSLRASTASGKPPTQSRR